MKLRGEITKKESYQGVNVLFDLPIDEGKADREAAEKYLKEMEEENSSEDETENVVKDTTIKEAIDASTLTE